MTYAYVTTETCTRTLAVEPGNQIHRNHDYCRWTAGKRETIRIIHSTGDAANAYRRRAAIAVSQLKGWSYDAE